MLINKYSILASVALFMGIASGMEGAASELHQMNALLLRAGKKCNSASIQEQLEYKQEIDKFNKKMIKFDQENSREASDTRVIVVNSTPKGARFAVDSHIAQMQARKTAHQPKFQGMTPDERYKLTWLLDVDNTPELKQFATTFGTEYTTKDALVEHVQNTFAKMMPDQSQ